METELEKETWDIEAEIFAIFLHYTSQKLNHHARHVIAAYFFRHVLRQQEVQ